MRIGSVCLERATGAPAKLRGDGIAQRCQEGKVQVKSFRLEPGNPSPSLLSSEDGLLK